jgi:hypothetical protein
MRTNENQLSYRNNFAFSRRELQQCDLRFNVNTTRLNVAAATDSKAAASATIRKHCGINTHMRNTIVGFLLMLAVAAQPPLASWTNLSNMQASKND